MLVLSDSVLSGSDSPSEERLKSYCIQGGSDVVENKLKETGWTDSTPATTVMLDFNGGEITNMRIHVLGFKEAAKLTADVLWGSSFSDKSYVKIEPLDFANFIIAGRMVSEWLPGDGLEWSLKIFNTETKKIKTISRLAEDALNNLGATKLWFCLHLSLDKGPRVCLRLGVAPTTDVTGMVGHGKMNFPIIAVGKCVKSELLPSEPEGAEFGTGFMPYLNHVGDGEPVLPSWDKIKEALCDLFNNSCKATIKYKHATWHPEVSKASWEVLLPTCGLEFLLSMRTTTMMRKVSQ